MKGTKSGKQKDVVFVRYYALLQGYTRVLRKEGGSYIEARPALLRDHVVAAALAVLIAATCFIGGICGFSPVLMKWSDGTLVVVGLPGRGLWDCDGRVHLHLLHDWVLENMIICVHR